MKVKDGFYLTAIGTDFVIIASTPETKKEFDGSGRSSPTARARRNLPMRLPPNTAFHARYPKKTPPISLALSAPPDSSRNNMDASMSYETLIAAAGSVVIEPRGISMLPFLKEGRDSVRLVSPTAAPCKYDIVLYRVRDEYVLHRIIGFDGDNYIICGDNCRGWERGHGRGDIIAVVDEIYRNGKPEKPHCLKNRIYERLWCSSLLKRIVMKLRKNKQNAEI